MKATSYDRRIHQLTDRLAGELVAFWRNDRVDVLSISDEALRRLMADYLLHRDEYLDRYPDLAYAIEAADDARTEQRNSHDD